MKLIERYLLKQFLGPTLLALFALVGVAVLSQALGAFEIIVEQGQSGLTFAQIVLLSIPQLAVLILPIAVFVGALIALNRLHTEHEIVVCFAGGMSRWRVMSSLMRLAAVAALLSLAVNLFIQPLAARTMRDKLFAIRTDLASTLVREGQFTKVSDTLTVYVQTSSPGGRLENVVINDKRPDGTDTTISAAEGRITRLNDRPVMLLQKGANQELTSEGVLNVLAFDEYVFDLGPYVNSTERVHYKISDRWLHELVFPDLRHDWERHNRTSMLAEAHFRISSPIYNISFMLMAWAAVTGGGFSRVGYGRRIAAMGAGAAMARILGFGAQAACDDNAWLNIVQYVIPLAAAYVAYRMLFRQSRLDNGLQAIGGAGPGSPQPAYLALERV